MNFWCWLFAVPAVASPLDPAYFLPRIPLVTFTELEESAPLVSSKALQKLIDTKNLRKGAEKLYECAKESEDEFGHPTRAIGTPGHLKSLEYLYDTFDELSDYYTVSTQSLTAIDGRCSKHELDSYGETIKNKPFSLTPGTDGLLKAPLFFADKYGCTNSDFKDAKGKIAVIKRGKCPFGEKSEFAGLNGAVGALIYDPAQTKGESPLSGDLGMPLGHQVATLGVDREWAESVEEGAYVSMLVDAHVYEVNTVNVIAETKEGDHDNVVMAGSHSDSVFAGPGINDNGSGFLSLLEVAKQLTKFKVNNAVRFAWWTAEELGLVGSLYYAKNLPEKEAKKIRMFFDYDMMASPNYVYEIYDSDDKENPTGSSAIRDLYIDFYESKELNYTLQPFDGRSDYVGFIEAGIPAGGIDAGAEVKKSLQEQLEFGGEAGVAYDHCYHQLCDNLDNLNEDAWLVNTQAIAHSIATFANSLKDFPARESKVYAASGPELRRPKQPLI